MSQKIGSIRESSDSSKLKVSVKGFNNELSHPNKLQRRISCSSLTNQSSKLNKRATGMGQSPTWEQLKAKILQAINRDEQPEVFEALLADARNFMTELVRTGQLAAISVELQEDAAVFF